MHRAFSLLVALVISATGFAAPASARDQWTTPQRLPAGQAAMVAVTSSGSGDIFSTYSANGILEVSRRPGGTWVRGREPVGGDGRNAVIDDDGNVTVAYPAGGYCAWDQGDEYGDSDPFHIEAKFRPFRSEDWRVFRLPGEWDSCNESEPALAVDSRGTVTAIWSGDGLLYAAQRRLGDRWSQPVEIGRTAPMTRFAIVAAGQQATAVWSNAGVIRSATTKTDGRWGRGQKVAELPVGEYPRAEHLSVAGTGERSLLVAWSDTAVRDREWYHRVRFATTDRRGVWRAPRTIDKITAEPNRVGAVVVAAHGSRAVLAWHKRQRGRNTFGPLSVWTRAGGTWSSTKLLDRRADRLGPDGLAATDTGAALVWTGGDPGNHFPLASTLRWKNRRWGAAQLLTSQDPPEAEAHTPWVVTYKPDVFTAAFWRGRATWATDLRIGSAR